MNNDLVLRVGFFTGISGAFFHSYFGIALSVLLQLFMGNFGCVGTADPWHPGILYGACVWFRYRGLKAYRTRIYECLNKAKYFAVCDVFFCRCSPVDVVRSSQESIRHGMVCGYLLPAKASLASWRLCAFGLISISMLNEHRSSPPTKARNRTSIYQAKAFYIFTMILSIKSGYPFSLSWCRYLRVKTCCNGDVTNCDVLCRPDWASIRATLSMSANSYISGEVERGQ